jgi:flagellar motor switch/type III secretory pathway protein FliN
VTYYLENEPERVATSQPVEAWLQLEQKDIKALAARSDELGQIAQETFNDRQSKQHDKNYQLRSAFADLLSHPTKIDAALKRYNQSIKQLEDINCQ